MGKTVISAPIFQNVLTHRQWLSAAVERISVDSEASYRPGDLGLNHQ